MDDKFYIVAGDGEELTSDFFQSVSGIGVPALTDDENARIGHLLKKIEELLSRQSSAIGASQLDVISDSLGRLEALFKQRQINTLGISGDMEKLERSLKNLSEKSDSNAYSLDSIEKSLAEANENLAEDSRKNAMLLSETRNLLEEIKENAPGQGRDEAAAVAAMFEEAARDIKKEVMEITRFYSANQEILKSLSRDMEKMTELADTLSDEKESDANRLEMIGKYLDQMATFMEKLAESSGQSIQIIKEMSETITENTTNLSSEQSENYTKTAEKIGEMKNALEEASKSTEKRLGEVEEEFSGMAEDVDKIKSDITIVNNKIDDNFQATMSLVGDTHRQNENHGEKIGFIESELISLKQRLAQDSEIISLKLAEIKDNQICADNSTLVERMKDLSAREEMHLTEISAELDKIAKDNATLSQRMDDEFLILREMIISQEQPDVAKETEQGNNGDILENMKDLSARQELHLAEISAEIDKIANDNMMISQKLDGKYDENAIIGKMKDLSAREELHLTEISAELDKLGRDNLLLTQKVEDNMVALKAAIDYLARSQAATADVLATEILKIKEMAAKRATLPKKKNAKKRAKKKMAKRRSKKVVKKPMPKPVVDEESIAKMDHSIMNALAAGKRRGVELTRIVKGDSKLFRARLRLLVSSGKIMVAREGKLVYYMLA